MYKLTAQYSGHRHPCTNGTGLICFENKTNCVNAYIWWLFDDHRHQILLNSVIVRK